MKLCFLVLLVFVVTLTYAQKMPFQGKLLNGAEPFTGSANFVFSIAQLGWSESHSDVLVQDGYYSVILGQINPIHDSLFLNQNEKILNISVNGESLSPVTLYAPILRTDLKATNFSFTGPNEKPNILLQSTTNNGNIFLFDENGTNALGLFGGNSGGRLNMQQWDPTSTFRKSLVAIGSHIVSSGDSEMVLYGLNATGDNIGNRLVYAYTTAKSITSAPYSNGYRRGGIDLRDNDNRLLAFLTSTRDESGADPTGKAGILGLYGTNTVNAELGGKYWDNANLGYLHLFGQNGLRNVLLETTNEAGEESGGVLAMVNTTNGGGQKETMTLWSNYAGSGAGGIAIQSESNENRLFFSAANGDGVFSLRNTLGQTTVQIHSGTGEVIANGVLLDSDARLKEQINPIKGSLSSVRKLQGVNYYWKDRTRGEKQQIGFIAQDMEKVFPELVSTNEAGYKSVNYVQLTAVLVEALKELDDKHKLLQAEVSRLQADNSVLKTELSDMEKLKKEVDEIKKYIGSGRAANK